MKKLFDIEVYEGKKPGTFEYVIVPKNGANEVHLAVFCNIMYERCIKFLKKETDSLLDTLKP